MKPSALRGASPAGLARDRSGATAVVVGLTLTALVGFAGLAVDAGLWYADRRHVQAASDSAAYSAAIDIAAGDTVAGARTAAKAITAQYGLTDGTGGVTVTVNSPPASGPNTSTSGAVEVILNKPETLYLSSFFINSAAVSARAVAVAGAGGKYCVLALDTVPATSVSLDGVDLSNGSSVSLNQCGLALNTPGSNALVVSGGAKMDAASLSVVGNYVTNNGGKVTISGTISTNAAAVADPYAGVPVPTPGSCTYNNASYQNKGSPGSPYTISPGTYCNGITFGNSSTIKMNPGVYIVDRGSFAVAGGSTIDATAGVTIVLTSSTGSGYATTQIDNGTTVTITAPNSGATSGLAMMQDSRAPTSGTVTMAGGTKFVVTGALYFPSQIANFSNGSTNSAACTQLVARRIVYSGGSKFGNNCAGVGVAGIGAKATNLAE